MDANAKKKLIAAVIAAALAIAVFYGLIDQKQASSIQNQADQTLGTAPAQQTTPQPATTGPNPVTPQNAPAAQNPTAAPAPAPH